MLIAANRVIAHCLAGHGDLYILCYPTSAREHRTLSCIGPSLLNIYIVPLQDSYSEALPTQAWLKRALWNSLPMSILTISFNLTEATFLSFVKMQHLLKTSYKAIFTVF